MMKIIEQVFKLAINFGKIINKNLKIKTIIIIFKNNSNKIIILRANILSKIITNKLKIII